MRDRLAELYAKAKHNALGKEFTCSMERNMYVADHLLANGVTVQEWISVKDRLPNIGCDVLFVHGNKIYGVGAYSDTYRDFFSGQFPVKGVTHWMPLPQPPKGVRS